MKRLCLLLLLGMLLLIPATSVFASVKTLGELNIGDKIVDSSWTWKHRTGPDTWDGVPYSGTGETKPVTWIVVAKDHYSGGDAGSVDGGANHVTLITEEIIGKHTFDNSTDRGHDYSEHGYGHWGDSGGANATHGIRKFLNGSSYSGSDNNSYVHTFYDAMSSDFKSGILTTTLPNKVWDTGSFYTTTDNVFLPSTTELGDSSYASTYPIGSDWGYFTENDSRVARIAGNTWDCLTRSPDSLYGYFVRIVLTGGGFGNNRASTVGIGVRPALNLKSDIPVSGIQNADGAYEVLPQYTLTYHAGTGGTISGEASQTVSQGNDGSEVTAVPATDYEFIGWDDGVDTASRTDTNVQADITVTANFALKQYTVTFSDYDGTELKKETVEHGSAATAPDDPTRTGYTFTGWDADFDNVTEDLTVTAEYDINQYTVAFDSTGGSAVSSQTLDYNSLVAEPMDPIKADHEFAGWYKETELTTAWNFAEDRVPANDITLYAKWTLIATISVSEIVLTGEDGIASIDTDGGTLQMIATVLPEDADNKNVTWSVSPTSGIATINQEGLLTATGNGIVTVTATAKDGSEVEGSIEITITNQLVPCTLDIATEGYGITQPSAGVHESYIGEEVSIKAIPVIGWQFEKWIINGNEITDTETTVTMDGNKTATAYFIEGAVHTLTVFKEGLGTTEPVMGNHVYAEGTEVALNAIPSAGWQFQKWVINGTEVTDASTTVTMDSDKTATAYFTAIPVVQHTLTIGVDGQGITNLTAGEHVYAEGTEVTLNAIQLAGWQFQKWIINGTEVTDASTTVTMDADKTATAYFTAIPVENFKLTISAEGQGTTYPTAGEHEYEKEATVTLVAIPAEGWQFEKWVIDETEVTEAVTVLTMTKNQSAKAYFTEISVVQHTLTIGVDGQGITNLAAGEHVYAEGTEVALNAIPSAGWQFQKWVINGTEVTDASTTVTMDADKAATAYFTEVAPEQYTLTVSHEGQGVIAPSSGSHAYQENTLVSLSAVPYIGWQFQKWVVEGTEYTDTTITVTMDADKTATAYFIETDVSDDILITTFTVGSTSPATELAPNELLVAKVSVTNTHDTVQRVMLIVALYNGDGAMEQVSFKSKSILAGQKEQFNAGFKLPSDITDYQAKAFLWDGECLNTTNMRPLSNVVSIPGGE